MRRAQKHEADDHRPDHAGTPSKGLRDALSGAWRDHRLAVARATCLAVWFLALVLFATGLPNLYVSYLRLSANNSELRANLEELGLSAQFRHEQPGYRPTSLPEPQDGAQLHL